MGISLHIDKYDPKGGKIVLSHLKRRGGPELENIVYEMKLVRGRFPPHAPNAVCMFPAMTPA
jgi:hypothetical protein